MKFPGQTCANIWGFAKDGKEYALLGGAQGMIVIDVTNPNSPVFIKQLTDTISSLWREIKTFGNYAYVTSEGQTATGFSGIGIANLTNLPDPNIPFKKYHGDGAIANLLKRTHALHIDTTTGYLYAWGATGLAEGGAVILNLNSDPYNPVYTSMFVSNPGGGNASYIHDGYVDNDTMYSGHIYTGLVRVVDMTNKAAPNILATFNTPNNFVHNTWPSQDKDYLFTTDEVNNSYLSSFDISDLNNVTLLDKIQPTPGTSSMVHNTHIKDHFAVTSWYKDGFTITDIARPTNLIQVGRYDIFPSGSGNGGAGCWGVYPYLPSGHILASEMGLGYSSGTDTSGLWVLAPTYKSACYLEGFVKDSITNFPLGSVNIAIQHSDPLNSTTSSAIDGSYATGQPTTGTFNLVYSKVGYITRTVSVTLAEGDVTIKDVKLLPSSLPVTISKISAKENKLSNTVLWEVQNQLNIKRYAIQKNEGNGLVWENIGYIDVTGDIIGTKLYSFEDKNPFSESFYRLEIEEMDGSVTYSDIVSVSRVLQGFKVNYLQPTVTTGDINLNIQSQSTSPISINVFDLSGKEVYGFQYIIQNGINNITFSIPQSLSNGEYIVHIQSKGVASEQKKIILAR